jgi:ElaB/YqjD/DUF883 family membrane-anchored ribosome-binding protein
MSGSYLSGHQSRDEKNALTRALFQRKVAGHAKTVKSAGSEAADIAETIAARVAANRLRSALESLQQSSDDMSKWAGARASEYKDQASDMVQKRPLSSLGALFAVGALLGVVAGIALRN